MSAPYLTVDQVMAAMGVERLPECELCGSVDAAWRFDVRPFKLRPSWPLTIDEFTCCDRCRGRVVAGDWSQVYACHAPGTPGRELVDRYRVGLTGTCSRLAV